jgi:hypothetical protein
MNKPIWIISGIFFLLFAAGMIPYVAGWNFSGQTALALDDGPALTPSDNQDQNKANESSESDNGDKADEQSGPTMPDMNPSEDSPDAPAKATADQPAEEKADIPPPEDQKQEATEPATTKPADATGGDKPATDDQSKGEQPAAKQQKRELNPAQVALRDKVRRTLAAYQKMPFNTRQNTADEIINYCLALGCNAEISLIDAKGQQRANGITCLCWNYPCAGYEPLVMVNDHISARLGYGAQSRPSQLLAALALSRVPNTYPMRVGDVTRTVADLIESEKQSCRSGVDVSLKLIGLAFYVEDATWKNDLGEEWSLEKMLKEELAQPIAVSSGAGIDRLLGLSYTLSRREKRKEPVEGQYARAKKYVVDFQNFALGMQNPDGSWGYFLSGKSANRDAAASLRSSGHVLQWLTLSLPEDRLDDPAVAGGIAYLNNTLGSQRYMNNLPALSTQEIAGAMRALHALAIYDERVFKPCDPTPAEAKSSATTAKNESAAASAR